ncbi:MAG TPA: NUDIX hydrolase [Chloroflexota bacterium]|nr:NUDIX hydrolase [Chloroflexota bacterium]
MKFCPNCATPLVSRFLHGQDRPACPTCGFVYYAGPKVAVGVLIVRHGRLLLNRRAIDPGKGSWSFPSGYVDLGETTAAAAVREVREETGFEIRLAGLVGVYASAHRPVVFVVYGGEIIGGEPTQCDEVEETGLFASDALPRLAFEHDEQIVQDWLVWRETGVSGGNLL